MKANNAPDKLYLSKIIYSTFLYQVPDPDDETAVEYRRADAFIEKACEFIKDHHHEFSFWNTEEYELGFSTQKIIEDFKNYMEGE